MPNRFWVSPLTASFDSTYWSTTSGGSSGASIPDSTDFAYFNGQGPGDCLIDGTTSVYGIELGSGYSGSVYLSGSCEVQRSLVLNGGHLRDGTINVYGDVCCNLGFGSFSTDHSAYITFVGSDKQSLFMGGGVLPHVEVYKSSSNQIKTYGDYPIYVSGDFLIQDGTFHTNGHDIVTYGAIIPAPPVSPYDVDFDWEIVDTTNVFISAYYEDMWNSVDGINWNQNTAFQSWDLDVLGGDGLWYGCDSHETFWVFGGYIDGVSSLIYSTDGSNFNLCNADNIFDYVNTVCTNGIVWLAGGLGTINSLAYSSNGIDWTGLGKKDVLDEIYDIKWNGTQFLAGGAPGSGTSYAMYSADGSNWYPSGDSSLSNVSMIVWDGSRWIVNTSYMPEPMAFSSDGSSWTTYPAAGLAIRYPLSISYSAGALSPKYVLVGRSSSGGLNSISYSTDASNWINLGNSLDTRFDKVVWNGTMFVAVSSNAFTNSIIYSYNGVDWTGLGTTYLSYGAYTIGYGKMT